MTMKRQALLGAAVILFTTLGGGRSVIHARPTRIQWDIVSVQPAAGLVAPGGVASAVANEGSKITLTGSGTFSVNTPSFTSVASVASGDIEADSADAAVSGGNWTTRDPNGNVTGTGTYRVLGPISFIGAPGTPAPTLSGIGRVEDRRAGLANLYVQYSDGSEGILVVSCQGDVTPRTVFEGVIASKGYVSFFNREAPQGNPFVDAGRTVFHVVR